MSFFSPSSSSSNNNDKSSPPKDLSVHSTSGSSAPLTTQLISQIQAETAVANSRALIDKVNEHCFRACVTNPGSALSGKEQSCIPTCMEKYIDTWNATSTAYVKALERSVNASQFAGGAGAGMEGFLKD